MTHRLIEENRKRELWFKGPNNNCYFFPQGWADDFADKEAEEPELYGYFPLYKRKNSEVETGWVTCSTFDDPRYVEIAEEEARELHPELGYHLDRINSDYDEDWL